jgi:hypothetical protein
VGAALGYGNTFTRADGGVWSARTNLFQLGVTATRGFGDFALSASAIGGVGRPDVSRSLSDSTARGRQALNYVGGTLRAEQTFPAPQGNFRLRADLTVLHLGSGALTEAGGFGRLDVNGSSMTNVSLSPAVEWSTTASWQGGYSVTPRVSLGVTQYLTDPSPIATASFADLGAAVAPMRVKSAVARTYGDIRLGLDIAGPGGLSGSLGVFGQVSGTSVQAGGGLQLSKRF